MHHAKENQFAQSILGAALALALVFSFFALPAQAQVANGCEQVETVIVSDTDTMVVGGGNAVAVTENGAWTASIPGATWIWDKDPADVFTTVSFERDFTVPGTVLSATLDIAVDNTYSASLNGNAVGSETVILNNFTAAEQDSYSVDPSFFTGGTETLEIEARNEGGPGGLLYKLTVTSEVCPDKCDCEGDSKVINKNKGFVKNVVITRSSTGGNYAGGSEGGDGGDGGDIYNGGQPQEEHDGDIRNVTTGSGGRGGNGGTGGTVITGISTAISTILNQLNLNRIIIRR